jgi:hypothetical protein
MMNKKMIFLLGVMFALMCLIPYAVQAQDDVGQSGLMSPFDWFDGGTGTCGLTSVSRLNGTYTRARLRRATNGRYFVVINFSPSGSEALGLLVSSADATLLVDYLNNLRLCFDVVSISSDEGFGTIGSRDDVFSPPRASADIDIELVLLPGGNISRNRTYAVYFVIDPPFPVAGQSHLYHSPAWHSINSWAVATRGSITYELWRNNPGAFVGTIEHRVLQDTPRPMSDDVGPGTAIYNALITGNLSDSNYRLYGGFSTAPQTMIEPPEVVSSEPDCPLAPRMVVGQLGIVDDNTPLPNRLRSQPSLSGRQLDTIPVGEIFSVIGGPVCADGYWWWEVDYSGTSGWTAEGTGGEYYIRPYGN